MHPHSHVAACEVHLSDSVVAPTNSTLSGDSKDPVHVERQYDGNPPTSIRDTGHLVVENVC